ncbi:hypothetical protein B0H11DRAFT_2283701 [Mycena galericulata]|nr:hypothetical protein B0H11DRAFT_2283701 [Mycena galericulata]
MSASNVLSIQELCDQIIDLLATSSADLKSCALVFPGPMTFSAQRHLFHDIVLLPGCRKVDDLYPSGRRKMSGEADACARFCSVLEASPHLVPLVRRLRVTSRKQDVMYPLSRVPFTNLEEIFFYRGFGGTPARPLLDAMAVLITLPSVRRVGLLFSRFDAADLSLVFHHKPHLDSLFCWMLTGTDRVDKQEFRTTIKKLQLRLYEGSGLIDSFDLSTLDELEFDMQFLNSEDAQSLKYAGGSITRMKIHGRQVNRTLSTSRLPLLQNLTALRSLEINVARHDISDIDMLLAWLPPTNRLEILVLEILSLDRTEPTFRRRQLARLGTAIAAASLPALHRVDIRASWLVSRTDPVEIQNDILAAFSVVAARDQVEVVAFATNIVQPLSQ